MVILSLLVALIDERQRFYLWVSARNDNEDLSIGGSLRRGVWRPLSLSVAL
ncbi:hypothetical protein F2Q69_00011686 [Brassica cretica]|uniref:Uncharacterized protein n=1 Tax=Brassica cretica TaxID=69181 RepID=A0A8S9R1R9_BRACR|nr:hypothetical protein F2Q69_00011686 [Brassica cretica]